MIAVVLAFVGIVSLLGSGSFDANVAKLPGYVLALISAVTYAFGTLFLKRYPVLLPPVASASWQLGIGCLPVAVAGLLLERPDIAVLTVVGWRRCTGCRPRSPRSAPCSCRSSAC